MAVHPGLRSRLFSGQPQPNLSEALAGILDLDAPEARLGAAEQALAVGLLSWAGESTDARALALGLSRRQAVRLRLCATLLAEMERQSWAMPAPISGPADVLAHLVDIRNASQERVVAIYLDSRNRPLHRETVAIGGLRASVIQPRDILRPAMQLPVAGLILAHNHPSGDTRPSADDLEVTRQLDAAARLFGIQLLDHIVVSRSGCTSIKEMGGL
ncbi:MAG TPA: JAB domain-containing protein [Candidatus Dormibacteraeota bacterium]|nr:JAB domain-containing protein [Candidatus Dormibacteraeota bacterium]